MSYWLETNIMHYPINRAIKNPVYSCIHYPTGRICSLHIMKLKPWGNLSPDTATKREKWFILDI